MNPIKLPDASLKALWAGRKIDAVRHLREQENMGLKEAHELIKQYIASTPELQERFKSGSGTRVSGWLALILLMALLAFLLESFIE